MLDRMIKNFDQLANTQLRSDGLEIIETGFQAISIKKIFSETVKREENYLIVKDNKFDLSSYDRIFFVAFGKCAVSMASEIEPLILDKLEQGIVLDVVPGEFKKFKSLVGTHPFISEQNISATNEIVQMISGLSEKDLVIICISGGGSALLTLPSGLSAEQSAALTRLAMERGATIEAMNTVRRHLSQVKGGGLAKMLYPATCISLIASDVPGNDLSTIASGPTVFDKTTVSDAQAAIASYDLFEILSWPGFELAETPKEEKYFEKIHNLLLLTNETGLMAMKEKAEALGYATYIEDESLQGNADEVGKLLASNSLPEKSCFLYGGETTVEIKGKGKGGRCQQLALSALRTIADNTLIAAVSSDGWDNSEAAGAMVDKDLYNAVEGGMIEMDNYLNSNDAFSFFARYGGQIITGRMGSNVSDYYLVIKN